MNIGEKIKRLRLKRGMTQNQLAGDEVSRNMLSLIEHDRATPSLQTLCAMAAKLKVSPAFLLAEKKEEQILLRCAAISDIRLAFGARNYLICTDLCQALYADGASRDDEIDLILSESLFGNAKEALLSDHVRMACSLLDESVFYAARTVYHTDHLIAAAALYFEYLGHLSPSLMSENLETERQQLNGAMGLVKDVHCRYMQAFLDGTPLTLLPEDPPYAGLLAKHITAKQYMADGDYERAGNLISDILNDEDILPGIIMYHVFTDMEECCRRLGNSRNVGMYQGIKMSLFEKLLS